MMTEQINRWEEGGWGRWAGLREPEKQAVLTLFFPFALLLLTGVTLQLGLLQGPVQFLCSLFFLEANLLFSSLPLLFLFPLKHHWDRIMLGDSDSS